MALASVAVIVGLALLTWGADRFVDGAAVTARYAEMPPLLIGMIVVGFGTSAPELASSVIAVRKGEHDIAFGNILGSNLFNTLAVVGIAGIIHPLPVASEVLYRDWTLMALLTVSLVIAGYGYSGAPGYVERREGVYLLTIYTAYLLLLVYMALN